MRKRINASIFAIVSADLHPQPIPTAWMALLRQIPIG
jgi:hypothetical protein